MIKNPALDERFDLMCRWEYLMIEDDEFDYEFFKLLAAHTFAFLYPYRDEDKLPRDIMSVLFRIKAFATCPISLSRENDAALLVAYSFCEQMENTWISGDEICPENEFVVLDYDGNGVVVDSNTFDLTDLL